MSSERARGHTSGHLDREHASMVVYDIVRAVRDHTWSIEHALDALEACVVPDPRITRIEATLERYDEARGEPWDDTHECAPEDRWRLYRDLYAILRGDQ